MTRLTCVILSASLCLGLASCSKHDSNRGSAATTASLKTNDTLVDVTQVMAGQGSARLTTLKFYGYTNDYKRPAASTKSQIQRETTFPSPAHKRMISA